MSQPKPIAPAESPRLTDLAHGGGCGCKLAPAVLRELLSGAALPGAFPDLLVGNETSDDAAVYRLTDELAVVSTTDFFTPIVDDPFDFGRIAAVNALSDIYAMGGRPIMALALLGMPLGKIAPDVVRRILAGGESVCTEAGIPIAGGHSIDSPEPIYGLAVTGVVHPARVRRNRDARAGDVLILGKPIGVGVISAALKSNRVTGAERDRLYASMVASATRLNDIGSALAELTEVHAMTDVTGFGLLGHLLEVCRGSGLSAQLSMAAVPVLDGVSALARGGCRTGAATRNWASYGDQVELSSSIEEWQRDLLCDPQTSGGLLVSLDAAAESKVLQLFYEKGFTAACAVATLQKGEPGCSVE